ncbi:hypothetical protein BFN67_12470 [Pseudaminobacter manganicus]|uniref:Uncharacterized protein n=1 Tax=Manganibacter manganicus TaxID=1873176 RepID=A0A1V8RUG3_9HYPH|nr:hypothetical protein BFN67_12470 [Pseudaminobacter manganicus]
MRIAILGWGSLIWDDGWPKFDEQRGEWLEDGPVLPLEFSRVSETRGSALTLVIDEEHGRECKVMYAMSKRRNPDDAIADLRDREGTILKRIGFYFPNDRSRKCEAPVPATIPEWAASKGIDVVVWTGLPSNFAQKNGVRKGETFSVDAAIAHLQKLTPAGKAAAATYVWRAPAFVRTPLRERLETEPWFKQDAS